MPEIEDKDDATIVNSAQRFFELMRKSHDIWHGEKLYQPQWVFRGQTNANWQLIPSVWRKTGNEHQNYVQFRNKLIEILSNPSNLFNFSKTDLAENQIAACVWVHVEFLLLYEFKRRAWLSAYPVHPIFDDKQFFAPYHTYKYPFNLFHYDFNKESFDTQQRILRKSDPSHDEDIALAQHYKIPTRMLDWTENPLIACFFATDTYPSQSEAKTDIVIYALNLTILNHLPSKELGKHENREKARPMLRVIFPNRRDNPYIKAQEGLLTAINWQFAQNYFVENGEWPSHEHAIKKAHNNPWSDRHLPLKYNQHNEILRKFILPAEHVGDLKKLLEREGITRDKIYPSLDHIAEAAKNSLNPDSFFHSEIDNSLD